MIALLRRFQSFAGLLAIVVLAIIFSPTSATGGRIFLEPGNLTDILRQMSLIGTIALAMTYVILTSGIDLSVGSILALSTSVVAMFLTKSYPGLSYPQHIALAIAMALAISAAVGFLNGLVIATLDLQPFVVTLASMIGIRGLAKWLTNNANIDIGFGQDVAASFADTFRQKPVVIGTYAVLAVIFGLVLARTIFGRYVRAIGDNERAARYTGLPIRRIKTWVYLLSGLLSGLAGVLYAAENHQGNPNAGVAYELDAIAAVVIGGTRLRRRQGIHCGHHCRHPDHRRAHQYAPPQ